MSRMERLEEDFRTTVQCVAGKLTHRELLEFRVLCDRVHVERLRQKEDLS